MHTLPPTMILLFRPFAPLFSKRVWMHVQILLVGALLAPAQRTVTASRVLLCLLVATFVPTGSLVVGIDETVERRTGAKITATGVSRDLAEVRLRDGVPSRGCVVNEQEEVYFPKRGPL